MKEDIKYLDKMVKEYKQFGDLHNPDYEDTDRIYQAIENLIKGYRELEALNKAHEEEIGRLEYCYEKALDDLIKTLKNSIPKSKIEDKIEELNKRIEQYDEYSKQRIETDVEFYENIADTAIVQVLQELMEDK